MKALTPSQTIGPFFAYCLTSENYGRDPIASNTVQSESDSKIRITGKVFEGNGNHVPDAMIEIWQCDAQGHLPTEYRGTNTSFTGFARSGTDENGRYVFETVKPGRITTVNNILQAPHIDVLVFARGLLLHLYTRIYFADESCNSEDPILSAIEDSERRSTLIAVRKSGSDDRATYLFDIHLQGDSETVFFQWRENVSTNN